MQLTPTNPFVLEAAKAGLTLLILAITWLLGQQILAYWEIKKKRKELDIATATQFQQLYGEFKEIWRLWKVFCKRKDLNINIDEDNRWELLKRATAAESSIEAIIIKLASERVLNEEEKGPSAYSGKVINS